MKKNLLLPIVLFFLFSHNLHAQCAASYTYSITSPNSVSFVNTSFGSGSIAYSWNFGDGQTASIANPAHTYANAGIYSVMLTINDSLGCADSIVQSVTINSMPFVNMQFFDDSLYYFCTTPASEDFYFYAYATGFPPTDSVKFQVFFGDGTDSVFYQLCVNTTMPGMFTHIYTNPGNYSPLIIMTGPNFSTDSSSAHSILVASTCGNITGTVYQDVNGNCIYDAGDVLLQGIPLEIYNGTNLMGWASTDSAGVYSFNVPTGNTCDIHVNAPGGYLVHLIPTCPSTGNITVSTIPSAGNDFGLSCPPGFDLQGWVTGWGFRPGFTTTVCVNVYNQFCNTPNGQIELVFDSALTPHPDSSGIGYTITGQTMTMPISSPDLNWNFCFPVTVSTNAQIGDSVCITMNLTPVVGDSFPLNNTNTFCFPVRNSFDPNDKYVIPAGVGAQGNIRPNTDLTYTIRFQNTGNAEAINIYILDTIDASLDISSIEVVASSHSVHWSTLIGNILRFNFDNIMLLDSNANEPLSHGYVTYRIKQRANVAHMTPLHNSASIYFDFNSPIYTNQTLNTVDQFLDVTELEKNSASFSIYPNPSNDKCLLYFNNSEFRKISIMDILGNEVIRSASNSDVFIFNTSKLPTGLYIVKVTNASEMESMKRLVVER